MNPFSRERKRSSLLAINNRELFRLKLFPLPSSRDNLQKRVETYSSFSRQEVRKILTELIEIKKFKQMVCTSLQLQYLYQPIISILQEQYNWAGQKIKISQIFEILIEGKFFRKLPKQSQTFFVNNNKNTQTNISCIRAAILVYASGKLNLTQIQRILKIFDYQQKLSETYPFGINIQYQKILKILKKIQRKVKPIQFKQWIQDFKKMSNSQKLQNFHFLYLVSLTQQQKVQHSYTFMDFHSNKDKKSKIQDQKNQQSQNDMQNEKKDEIQNQKHRIRSFSYKENRCTLPSVIAFQDIKSHLNETEEKLKEKKKSMSLLSRIKTKFQTSHDQNVFNQIKFDQNKLYKEEIFGKVLSQSKTVSTQRKSRVFSTQENTISRISIFKDSKNKQNHIIPSQKCNKLIKQKLVLNLPNKTKKLTLNRDQQKISLHFANIFDHHEKKIQNQMRHLQNQLM